MRKTPLFVLLCLVLCVFSQMPTPVHAAWWDASWYYKIKLTIDQTKVDADLTDFPVLVYLNSSRINWALVQDDLDDLRFVNSTENGLLSAELEKSVTNSEAWIWVKVPAVSGSVDTVIYVYYGNVGAASAWDAENVWDASAMMVQHMVNATTTTIIDSTANNNDGTSAGSFGASAGTSYTTVAVNQMYGSKFTSPAGANGVLNSITWYGRTVSGAGNAKAVLVNAASLAIIAVSNPVATTATAGEWTNVFASPPAITASTDYLLMMVFDVSTRFNYGAGTTNQGFLDTTNSYATPTDPADATNNNNQYRIRAVYTPTLAPVAGEIDSALDFKPNNYISTPLDINGYSAITMEAWINPGDLNFGTTQYKSIIGSATTVTGSFIYVDKLTYKAGFWVKADASVDQMGDDALMQGNWYYIVGVYNGTNLKLYVNGVVQTIVLSETGVLVLGDSTFIGHVLSDRYWNGIIDEARVYDTAKSAEWIKADYNSGADTLLAYSVEYTRTPLTVYFNAGINKLYINGTHIANGTTLQIDPDTNVNATATAKLNHLFFKHQLTGSAPNFTTPYLFNMTTSNTLWTYAVVGEVAGASSGALIFTGLLCLIVIIPFIWRRRS